MATSGTSRPSDIVVKSIEWYNRRILDRDCNLSVPTAFIDDLLTVDVGGNVVLQATTVDLSNSTIDFSGAAVDGFVGNIQASIDSLIDNSGGTDGGAGGTIAVLTDLANVGSADLAVTADAIATLAGQQDRILDALRLYGIIN